MNSIENVSAGDSTHFTKMDPTSLLNWDNSSKRKLDHLPETKVTTQGDEEDPEQPPKKKSKVIPDQEKRAEGAQKRSDAVCTA